MILFAELKNQAYFDGIDWDMLADGRSDAPFNPNNIQINLKTPTNLADLLETAINDEHEPIRAEYYCSKLELTKNSWTKKYSCVIYI